MKNFQTIINQKVERLFVILWPPLGEERMVDVDLSIGFVFAENPQQLCVIYCTGVMPDPEIRYELLPSRLFDWDSFDFRVKSWMDSVEFGDFDKEFGNEYYEATGSDIFKNIVSHSIRGVELVTIRGDEESFAAKVIFENDYVLVTPTCYGGTTIETACFNQNDNLSVFKSLGEIEYRQLV